MFHHANLRWLTFASRVIRSPASAGTARRKWAVSAAPGGMARAYTSARAAHALRLLMGLPWASMSATW